MKLTDLILRLAEMLKDWKEYFDTDSVLFTDDNTIETEYYIVKWKEGISSALPSVVSEELSEIFKNKCK